MDTQTLGAHYSRIADWWEANHKASMYGVEYVEQAIRRVKSKGNALDVGCGSGGKIIETVLENGFSLTALDVSEGMIRIAKNKHPEAAFVQTDLLSWSSTAHFDLVIAWDSIFHASRAMQRPVIENLCDRLAPDGVLLFTAGGIDGDMIGADMNGVGFEYGSLHYGEYLEIIEACGCGILTMT